MYKVILILDRFFVKYEHGGGSNWPPSRKTILKKPSLIRVDTFTANWIDKENLFCLSVSFIGLVSL